MTTDQTKPTSDGIEWSGLGTEMAMALGGSLPSSLDTESSPSALDPDQCQRKTDKLAFFPFSDPFFPPPPSLPAN